MDAFKKVLLEMQTEGSDFELDPRFYLYFEKIGHTEEQIDLVQGIARRIARSQRDSR
jgi:hypothetical protein